MSLGGKLDADIEVVVFASGEGHFLGGCITSVMRAVVYAEANGRSVVLTVVVQAATPLTRAWVSQRLNSRWRALHCPGSTLSEARNTARLSVTGHYAAFIDGYDLWCETWLDRAVDAATRELGIWHPEVLITFGNDFHSSAGYSVMFQPRVLGDQATLLSGRTFASGFLTSRAILIEHPWPDADPERGWDTPDHWWNCNVAAAGHLHRVLPAAFHYRRIPDANVGRPGQLPGAPRCRIGPTRLARSLRAWRPELGLPIIEQSQ